MIKKTIAILSSLIATLTLTMTPTFAHVIVHPSSVGVAAFQEFSMSVPTEKDNPTVGLKLLIPDGLNMITPNVKAGWTITLKKHGSGDDAQVTEIDWTGGSIPPGQRDDFYFQAQVPAKETTINWKAYQTYQDGSMIAWDHDPKLSKGPDDDTAPPPYSTTKIINDLKQPTPQTQTNTNTSLPLGLSIIALILATAALATALRRK
jgi:uncharacterized protein YcnI